MRRLAFALIAACALVVGTSHDTDAQISSRFGTWQWSAWGAMTDRFASGRAGCAALSISSAFCLLRTPGSSMAYSWDGSVWRGDDLPTVLFDPESAQCVSFTLAGNTEVNCFARRTSDNRMVHRRWRAGESSPWIVVGGPISSAPSCAQRPSGLICFTRAAGGALAAIQFHGDIWDNDWTVISSISMSDAGPSCAVHSGETVLCMYQEPPNNTVRAFTVSTPAPSAVAPVLIDAAQTNPQSISVASRPQCRANRAANQANVVCFGLQGVASSAGINVRNPDGSTTSGGVYRGLVAWDYNGQRVSVTDHGEIGRTPDQTADNAFGDIDCVPMAGRRLECMELRQGRLRQFSFVPGTAAAGQRDLSATRSWRNLERLDAVTASHPRFISCFGRDGATISCVATGAETDPRMHHIDARFVVAVQPNLGRTN